jgi:peptidyl-Asp metalloendopeptidase
MRKLLLCLTVALVITGCAADSQDGKIASHVANNTATGLPQIQLNPPAATRSAFASLADRGALFAYDRGQQPVQRGAQTYHAVQLSEAHALNAAAPGKSIELPTPSGGTMRIDYQRHEEGLDGNWSWVGKTSDGLDAVITFGESAVFGRIAQRDTEALRLTMSAGRSWLVESDPSKMLDGNLGRDAGESDVLIPPSVAAAVSAKKRSAAAMTASSDEAASAANTVDVVLGFTNGLVTKYGSAANANTRLSNLVAITNQGYQNSLVIPRIRLVRTVQVSYTDTNSNETALEAVTGFTCSATGCTAQAVPTELVPLRTARDQYGGDLVSIVRPFQAPQHQGCGIAWLLGAQGFIIDNSDAPFGYSVVSDGTDVDEGDGRTYFCREETLAHELGHNMGQQHNIEDAGNPPDSGMHPYSYGYREATTTGFYTVMAYRLTNSSQFSINYFGNPSVNYLDTGRPTGTAAADNARSLNITMPLVVQFRAAVVVFPGKLTNDYDGDGRSDIHWRNVSTGRNDIWLLNGASVKSFLTVYNEPNQTWGIVGSGDFNNDGQGDQLWRNTTSGAIYVQLMQNGTTLATSRFAPTVADPNWQIVAIDDFDGNGTSDLYWRNGSTGRNDLWLMNGGSPSTLATVYNEPNVAWKIRGAGDFNGDGRADLFWRNDATGRNYIQFMNGLTEASGSAYTVDVADQSWQVVAIADFDADGREDLYWRNSNTGRNDLWLMTGAVIKSSSTVYNEPNQNWQIVNNGDYNGDGFADLLWRNSATGGNYVMLMQSTAILPASGSLPLVADLNWRITGLKGSN